MTFKQIATGLFSIIIIIQLFIIYSLFLRPSNIVYVDSNVLLENYEGMKVARQAFQQKASQWQANIDTLRAELDEQIKTYEAEKIGMTAKEMKLSEELIQTKRQQFIDYQKGIQQKSQQEDFQMTQQVLTEVNSFIEEYGRKKGYKIILGANNSGNIVYAEELLDITADLQKALSQNYQGF